MSGQQATREIVEYGLRRNSEFLGDALDGESSVRPPHGFALCR